MKLSPLCLTAMRLTKSISALRRWSLTDKRLRFWMGAILALSAKEIHIASTFHKFALDIMKLSGARPELISEEEHDQTIRQALRQALRRYGQRTSTREFEELVKIVSGFVTRAGQKYSGTEGLERLHREIARHLNNTNPKSHGYTGWRFRLTKVISPRSVVQNSISIS